MEKKKNKKINNNKMEERGIQYTTPYMWGGLKKRKFSVTSLRQTIRLKEAEREIAATIESVNRLVDGISGIKHS